MPIFHDRAQETSSNTPASSGAISITLNGATTYNRTFAGAGYVNADAVLVHVWQTSNPALWCVVPGQFVDTPDRITFTDTDIEDGSAGPGVSPTWTGTVTVGVEMVASLAAAASGAEQAGTAAAEIAAHLAALDPHTQYLTQAEGDAAYSAMGHNHAGVYEPANANIQSHIASTANPHSVTAAQVGAYTSGQVDTLLAGKSDIGHTHAALYAPLGNWVEEASNVVARRNGANAQSLRLYNTYTNASNYERLSLTGTAGSSVELKAESAGTGAENLDVRITPKGAGRPFIGQGAGALSVGIGVLAYGQNAGFKNTTGDYWTAIGGSAAYNNTTAGYWTVIGYSAGYNATTGSHWVAIGYSAGFSNTTGTYWTAIGTNAARSNASSSNWLACGANSARYLANGSTSATNFADSTYIGSNTKVSANSVTNETAIGYNAIGSGSNTVTIGNSSVTGNYFSGLLDATGDKLRLRTAKTPASAADTGNQGDICWDSSYLYVCTAADTWKRALLATWA